MIKYGNNTFTSKLGIDGFWYLYMNDTEVYMCHDDNLPKDLKTVPLQFPRKGNGPRRQTSVTSTASPTVWVGARRSRVPANFHST